MQHIFDIKKTQLELARDRGYDITDEAAILNMSLNDFVNYISRAINQPGGIRNMLSHIYKSREEYGGDRRRLVVFYGERTNPQQKQISIDIVRTFISIIQNYSASEAIFIVDAPLSSDGNLALSAVKLVKWQVFNESELTYNPTTHVDTPRHELLSEEEKIAKLREMRVDVSKLLLIKSTDPVVRYYGWTPGGIVRIHRDDSSISILAPKSINYRVIV